LYDILPDEPKEAVAIRRKAPNSTTMQSQEYCIADRMMKSSSAAYHIKRHTKHLKKLITVCAELTSLFQSLVIDFEDLDIIGQRDP